MQKTSFFYPATSKAIAIFLGVLASCSTSFAESVIHITPQTIALAVISLQHAKGPTKIIFSAGEYYFSSSLEVASTSVPLTLEGEGRAVISGGVLLNGWKQSSLNGHSCWAVDMPAVRFGSWYFRELWVNGKRATRARYPATGYLSAVLPTDDKNPWNLGQNWFGFRPGDVPVDLPATDVEAIIMNRWVEARLPISKIDSATHRIECLKNSQFQLLNGDLYFLEGSPVWLQHPGDWYLDRVKGTLFYSPCAGETIDKLKAIAPRLPTIIKLHGASDVTFRGLTFSDTEWNLPDAVPGHAVETGGFAQAALGVPAAVKLEFCHHCQFESCTFQHLGNYGLEIGKACQENTVDHCTFTDLGAGAIKIGVGDLATARAEQVFNNIVTDCRIIDCGKMYPSACGIWIGQSYGNQIEHNEIADLHYTAISAGWTWGYGNSLNRDNHFTANLIHHIGKKSDGDGPILSDMGAIYTLGARAGTVITDNVFHDISARVYGGWGAYLDEGSSNVLVEKNLVYRTTHGGFHLHYGHGNIVQNNVFALGRDVQIARTRTEPELSLTFKHNIVYWDSGVFTATDSNGVSFDENLYQCLGDTHLKFGANSWAQWRATGQDVHSILGDAMFTNPSVGDFSMRGYPADQIHFMPLAVANAGPRTK